MRFKRRLKSSRAVGALVRAARRSHAAQGNTGPLPRPGCEEQAAAAEPKMASTASSLLPAFSLLSNADRAAAAASRRPDTSCRTPRSAPAATVRAPRPACRRFRSARLKSPASRCGSAARGLSRARVRITRLATGSSADHHAAEVLVAGRSEHQRHRSHPQSTQRGGQRPRSVGVVRAVEQHLPLRAQSSFSKRPGQRTAAAPDRIDAASRPRRWAARARQGRVPARRAAPAAACGR